MSDKSLSYRDDSQRDPEKPGAGVAARFPSNALTYEVTTRQALIGHSHTEEKMRARKLTITFLFVVALIVHVSCKRTNSLSTNSSAPGAPPAETGVEKVKPAAGTGNVQGKVYYNSKPAENIEVKLCETFSKFLTGCGGKIYTAKTDKDGEYVITNVPPMTYKALLAKVFDTDSSIFATTGIAGISAAEYVVTADKTLFATTTHLFKGDLKTSEPKAGAKVKAEGLELKWESYPDATYYKFSVYADDHLVTSPYIGVRVETTTYGLDKPLPKGSYRWKVEAYNRDDRKLSESADDLTFSIIE